MRKTHRSGGGRGRKDHKTHQLCKQVGDAIQYALGVECEDPKLHQLIVDRVMPAPSARRMRVILYAPYPEPDFDRAQVQACVENITGLLREEVANHIHRKRVPELVFHVLSPGEHDP